MINLKEIEKIIKNRTHGLLSETVYFEILKDINDLSNPEDLNVDKYLDINFNYLPFGKRIPVREIYTEFGGSDTSDKKIYSLLKKWATIKGLTIERQNSNGIRTIKLTKNL